MIEDKQKICDLLLPALQATRDAADLTELEYENDEVNQRELVTATFIGGGFRIINVSMDSGTAMIKDIINHLGC